MRSLARLFYAHLTTEIELVCRHVEDDYAPDLSTPTPLDETIKSVEIYLDLLREHEADGDTRTPEGRAQILRTLLLLAAHMSGFFVGWGVETSVPLVPIDSKGHLEMPDRAPRLNAVEMAAEDRKWADDLARSEQARRASGKRRRRGQRAG